MKLITFEKSSNEITFVLSREELLMLVSSLELVAKEQSRVSFIPVDYVNLPQWKMAQQIKSSVDSALKLLKGKYDL